MKKWLSLLLVCVLLFPCAAALGESAAIMDESAATEYDCSLTASVISADPKEVLDSPTNRAMLTICLLLDLVYSQEKDFVAEHLNDFLKNESYVSYDGKQFAVLMYMDETIVTMAYNPEDKQARFLIKDTGLTADSTWEILEETAKINDCAWKNDSAEISKILKYINEGLSSD